MTKVKNPCPYHPEVELERRGRANWHCSKCGRNMMLELTFIYKAQRKEELLK